MNTEFSPCPFCASPTEKGALFESSGIWIVRCENSKCKAEVAGWTAEQASEKWNRRAALSPASPATGEPLCGSSPMFDLSTPQPAAAHGWVMVPREPTSKMLDAAADAWQSSSPTILGFVLWEKIYRSMLAAAPQPQEIGLRDAYEGAREDLLDWKRRAQKAEATLRSLGYTGITPDTPPAHGDGEGDCSCPSGDGSLRWPCPKHPPSLDTNVAAVHRKLDERSAKGVREYGVTTDGAGLSRLDWLLHLQEELIDGAVYVQAALTTRPTPEAQEAGDAARYRAIRNAGWEPNGNAALFAAIETAMTGEQLDDCIDAALALPAQGEGR